MLWGVAALKHQEDSLVLVVWGNLHGILGKAQADSQMQISTWHFKKGINNNNKQ